MTKLVRFSFLNLAVVMAVVFFVGVMDARAEEVSANDTARYLAGLEPGSGSGLSALVKEAAWVRHSKALDRAWAGIEKNQLKPIGEWSEKYIQNPTDFVMYNFSGPDFLYANAFYPNASTYVLSALEPVGPIPNLSKLSRGARSTGLSNLRVSMQAILNYSFFITKKMKTELRETKLKGTLPVLYVFLARAGMEIEKAELISLDKDGNVSAREGKTPKGSAAGVKIGFKDKAGQSKTLYYFSTDISNGGLKRSGFLKFCDGFGRASSLIKSASYLPHSANFKVIRNYVLEKSDVLVQDDSGVPIRYFDKDQWDLKPFGRYLGPISLFPKRYQRDAQRLFKKPVEKKMTFGIGYRWRRNETNVLLAIKKSDGSAAAE